MLLKADFIPCFRDCGSRRKMADQKAGERKKKETIVDLSKYMDKSIKVKFSGARLNSGREVLGTLKGYDPLLNLVLDDCKEYLRDPEDPDRLLDQTRDLGLVVCRGTAVVLICPTDGMEEIDNPFVQE